MRGQTKQNRAGSAPHAGAEAWALARKFLDYLEANAEEYWRVPQFEMAAGDSPRAAAGEEPEEEEEAGRGRRSVRRGLRGRELPRQHRRRRRRARCSRTGRAPPISSWCGEAERIVNRLDFLTTVAQLWKIAAMASVAGDVGRPRRGCWPAGWTRRSATTGNCWSCWPRSIATGFRRRAARTSRWWNTTAAASVKETLLEEIIDACVETADAARMIRAVDGASAGRRRSLAAWERLAGERLRGRVSRRRGARCASAGRHCSATLRKQPLLYVALGRGGNPQRIVASRGLPVRAAPPVGVSAPAGAVDGNLPPAGDRPEDGGRASGRAGRDHRVRPRLRDRLPGHRPLPGRLVGRLAGGNGARRAAGPAPTRN